jgi:hypothetical protein
VARFRRQRSARSGAASAIPFERVQARYGGGSAVGTHGQAVRLPPGSSPRSATGCYRRPAVSIASWTAGGTRSVRSQRSNSSPRFCQMTANGATRHWLSCSRWHPLERRRLPRTPSDVARTGGVGRHSRCARGAISRFRFDATWSRSLSVFSALTTKRLSFGESVGDEPVEAGGFPPPLEVVEEGYALSADLVSDALRVLGQTTRGRRRSFGTAK